MKYESNIKRIFHEIIVKYAPIVISSVALYFSYDTNKRDIVYREIGILPSLTFSESSSLEESSLKIENQGIGPARIKKIILRSDNKCFQLEGLNNNFLLDQDEFYSEFLDNVKIDARNILASSISAIMPKIVNLRPTMKGQGLNFGVSIAQGKEFSLISIGMGYEINRIPGVDARKIESTLPNLKEIVQEASRSAFKKVLRKRSFVIYYCSISEITCHVAYIGDKTNDCNK